MKYWLRNLCAHLITHVGETPPGRLIVLPIENDVKIHYLQQEQELAKSPSASPGLGLARKFQHLLLDCDFCCACRNALSRRAHIYKDPLLQRAGSGYPAEHSLDPTKNSFIPVVLILLSLSNVQAWAKVTAENGQSCLVTPKGDGNLVVYFPCINITSYKTP